MNAQISALNARFDTWQQVAEKRYAELSDRDLLLSKRLGEDELHIYKNEQRLEEIYRRMQLLEQRLFGPHSTP